MHSITGFVVGLFQAALSIFGIAHENTKLPPLVQEQTTKVVVQTVTQTTKRTTQDAVVSPAQSEESLSIATGTAKVSNDAPVSVSGMAQYTDVDFGFSFWYPSTWKITNMSETGKGMFAGTTDKSGNVSAGRIMLKGDGVEIDIDKIISGEMTYKVNPGACGYCGPVNFFFDPTHHLWMKQYPEGPHGAPDATPEQIAHYKVPTPADISRNTMGGLHIFSTEQKENASIIPLSATRFLVVGEYSGQNPGSQIHMPLVSTIFATDSSVATATSTEVQIGIIVDEQKAYTSQ